MQSILRHLLIFISMISGLIIYLGFRTTHTPIYHWAIKLGWKNELSDMRNSVQHIHLPDWIVYSLPDGLWMFSFVMAVLTIWNYKLNSMTWKWIISAICIGLGFELIQGFVKGMGVFDWTDLFLMIIASAIALGFFSDHNSYEKRTNVNQSFTQKFFAYT